MNPPIPVQSVSIERCEGPKALCVKRSFQGAEALTEASIWLSGQSSTFPSQGGGYDKCAFTASFADGFLFRGRMDCKSYDAENPDLDVRKHILDYLTWTAGRRTHPWCGPDKYRKILQDYGPDAVTNAGETLDKYSGGGGSWN